MRRVVALAVLVAVFACAGYAATRLTLDEDILQLLPSGDPTFDEYRLLVSRFAMIDAIYVDVGASLENRAQAKIAADTFADALRATDAFRQIHYRTRPQSAEALHAALSTHRPMLLDETDYAAVAERFTDDAIRRRLNVAKRSLLEPAGPLVRRHVQMDPLGLSELLLRKMQGGDADAPIDGRIWSPDGNHILLVLTPKGQAMDAASGETAVRAIESARASALASVPAGSVDIAYFGYHRAALENARVIEGDLRQAATYASVAIFLLTVVVFRRRRHALLAFVPCLFGLCCVVIGFAVAAPVIPAVTVGCAVLLVGISVDYGVHVLYRIEHPTSEEATAWQAARDMWFPLAMGAATTVAGLLCLLLVPLPGQWSVGIMGAIGLSGAALFSATVLPLFVTKPAGRAVLVVPLADACRRGLRWRSAHRHLFWLLGAALLVTGLTGAPRVTFEGDLNSFNYMSAETRYDEILIEETWGGLSTCALITQGSTLEQALARNDETYVALLRLVDQGKIARLRTIAPILPAQATQRRRAEGWTDFRRTAEPGARTDRFLTIADELEFSPSAFQPFLDSLDSTEQPLVPEDFAGTGLDTLLDGHISHDARHHYVLTTFAMTARGYDPAVATTAKDAADGNIVVSKMQLTPYLASFVRRQSSRLGVYAFLAMVICLMLFLRKPTHVLAVLAPVLGALLLTLGVLGHLDMSINFLNCLFIVFIFGVGVDYSVFLFAGEAGAIHEDDRRRAVAFGAVLICALSTLCGFFALACARHPGLASIGSTGAIGMLASLVAAVIIVPDAARLVLRRDTPELADASSARAQRSEDAA